MKNILSTAPGLFAIMLTLAGCDKLMNANPGCQSFELNKPFLAQPGEQWCLEETNWRIQFGSAIEDSRCNVEGIDCVWAGRFVMEATINDGIPVKDTFEAVHNWSDTLYHGPYSIILAKIYPEMRDSMGILPSSQYSFDVIVKN